MAAVPLEDLPSSLRGQAVPEDDLPGARPAQPKRGERTWTEAAQDIGAGVVGGIGSLVQLPGQLAQLAGSTTPSATIDYGKQLQELAQSLKSQELVAREQERARKVAEAEKQGQMSAFGTAFSETVKDPALLLTFLAEQAPQLLVPFGAGRVAGAGARALGAGEAAAAKAAVGSAVGAGATQQGADVGADAYANIYKELKSKGATDVEAAEGALRLARQAGAGATVISALTQMLPGARVAERVLAGVPARAPGVGRLATAGKAALGETISEIPEEVGGKIAANLAMREVKPEQDIFAGAGEAAALAAIGAAGLGGVTGLAGRQAPAEVTPPPPAAERPPAAPPGPTDVQRQIEETVGIKPEAEQQPMLTSEEANRQRLLMLQQKVDEDARIQAERAAKEGPRPEVPEVVTDRSKPGLYETQMPQATPQEELEAKQSEIDKLRLQAGLPTSKGEMPPTTAPERPTEPKIVDNRPLEERAAKNRLLVMQNMLKNEGGDPASLSIVPHPTAEGKFAIQSLDRPTYFQELEGTKKERPVEEIDPVNAYIEIARRTNTPASMRLVRDFEEGILTRDDIMRAVEAERKAGQPLPLNYKGDGTPWFIAPETRKPRGERELPPGARLTPIEVEGPFPPGQQPPTTPPTTTEQPPTEPPTGEEPPPPTGKTPETLEEFKSLFPIERDNTTLRDANERGDFRAAMDHMAASKNPAVKRIGELGRTLVGKVKLHKPGSVGAGVAGVYRYADDSIQMAKKYAGDEWTNAHETAHALVAKSQRFPTDRQKPIVRDIENLYKHVKLELGRKGMGWGKRYTKQVYGLANEREFVAEAMSNPEFQYMLMQVPYKGKRSAWTEFVRLVADMLGIQNTNALTEILNLTDKLAKTGRPKRTPFDAKDVEYIEGVTPQEREANFKKWFGNSKVVDEDGKPLVVYHGTNANVSKFSVTDGGSLGDGIYFTDRPSAAAKFAERKGDGANVMPVYLRAERVLDADNITADQVAAIKSAIPKSVEELIALGYPEDLAEQSRQFIERDLSKIQSSQRFEPKALALAVQGGPESVLEKIYDRAGFDAITRMSTGLIGQPAFREYLVFRPDQIKSATGNRGTFSSESPEIEALQIPGFGKKEEAAPTRQSTGQQAMDIVSQTGMTARPPEPTAREKAKTALLNAKDDPKLAASQAKTFLQNLMDKVETWAFSGDAKFNNDIRRNLMQDFKDNPEIMGMLIEASQSQAVHSDALATQFIVEGGIAYDEDTKKWVAVKKEDNFIKLAKDIDALSKKHGLTKEEAERVAHTYFVAKRFKSLNDKQAEREAEIARLEAESKREQDPVRRKGLRSEIDKLKKAEVFITDEQKAMIAPGLSLGKLMPELESISDTWQGIRVNAIKAMVDGQLWSYADAERMLDNIDYVPFYREEQLEEGGGPQEFIKGLQVKADEYRLKGSASPVNDVFDNMVRWTQYAINRSVRNHKALQMIDLGKEINVGEQKMATKVETKEKGANVVRVFRDGQQELYEVADPMYMDAFASISNVAIPSLRFFSWMSNLLRQSVVLYPAFSLAQVPQDAFSAMFSSGLQPQFALRIPALAVKEFVKTLKKTSSTHDLLKKYGAVGVRDFSASVARQDVEIASGLKAPKDLKGKIIESLSHVAMAADNSIRQAVYEASMQQGLSKAEAIEKAFEIINFRRRGTSKAINLLGQMVPFFYAYMSVQRTSLRTLSGVGISPQERSSALKTLGYTTAAVMAFSLLYTMANAGDDEYEKTPAAIRDRTLHVPGTIVRIPLRPDFFLFPKIVTEHLYHMITDNGLSDGAAFRKSMGTGLVNAIAAPQPIPQAAKPLLEVGINYDFFQGRPIVGPFEQKKEAERQFNDNTSELSKILGSTMGLSPTKIDHVIRGMFGSVGGLTLWATNLAASPFLDVQRPDKTFQDMLASIPGTSGFVTRTNESRLKNQFYELRDEVEKANETFKDIRNRTPHEVEAFIADEKNIARLGLAKTAEKVTRELSNIRKAIGQITNAPSDVMSSADKQARIKELRDLETQMLKSINVSEMRKTAKM